MNTYRRLENENDVCMNEMQTKKLYDSIFCLGASVDANSTELPSTEWYENDTRNSMPKEMRKNAENHRPPQELQDSLWSTDPKNDYRGLTGKYLSTISEDAREFESRDQTAKKVTEDKTDKYKAVRLSQQDRSDGKNIKNFINVLTAPTWMKRNRTKRLVYLADNIGSDAENKPGLEGDAIPEDNHNPEDDAIAEDKPSLEGDEKTEGASGLDYDGIVEDEGYLDEVVSKPRWSRDVVESLRIVEHIDEDLSEDEENNWGESKGESTVLPHAAIVNEVEVRSDEEYEYLDTEGKLEYHYAMDLKRPDLPTDRDTSGPQPVVDEENVKSVSFIQPQIESNIEDEFIEDKLSSQLWENEQPDESEKEHFDEQYYKADFRDWEVPIETFQPTPQLSSDEMSIGSAIRRRLHPEFYNVTNKWVSMDHSEIVVESSEESLTSLDTAEMVQVARQFKPPATVRIDDDVPPSPLSETVMFSKTVNSLGTYLVEGLQETSKRGRSDPFLFLGRWLLNQADLRDHMEQDLLSSSVDDN